MDPFDDLHRYHRPAALIARTMSGGDIEQMLEWLHPQYSQSLNDEFGESDMQTFKAFGVKPPRRS